MIISHITAFVLKLSKIERYLVTTGPNEYVFRGRWAKTVEILGSARKNTDPVHSSEVFKSRTTRASYFATKL